MIKVSRLLSLILWSRRKKYWHENLINHPPKIKLSFPCTCCILRDHPQPRRKDQHQALQTTQWSSKLIPYRSQKDTNLSCNIIAIFPWLDYDTAGPGIHKSSQCTKIEKIHCALDTFYLAFEIHLNSNHLGWCKIIIP